MVMIVCTVGLSISILVYIIVFQYVFAYKLGWFPVQGWGNDFWENLIKYASLPILIGLTGQHRAQPAAVPHVRAR
jgi:peptide/nickel transport system permease protein